MTPNEERRPAGNRTPLETAAADAQTTASRCACCGARLTARQSVLRGLGPVCAAKHTDLVRVALVADLDALRATVATAPVSTLALVRAGVVGILDALNVEGAIA